MIITFALFRNLNKCCNIRWMLFGVQNSMASASCCKVIVDCDPGVGVDDAHAIIMLLEQKHIEVVAVTTVFGNSSLESSSRNAVRVLKLCRRLDVCCMRFL